MSEAEKAIVSATIKALEIRLEEAFAQSCGLTREDFARRSFLVTNSDGKVYIVTPKTLT